MSSTNKTANYELSQFIGTDKPAWLTDYNSDMSKIDAGIDAAKDTADAASGSASAANTAIGDLTSLQTTDKTSLVAAVNEVNLAANTAQGVANSASGTANSALTEISKFNLSNVSTLTPSVNIGQLDASSYVRFATDNTSSVFKVYGRVQVYVGGATSGTLTIKIGETSLRPDTGYTIEGAGYMHIARKDNAPATGIPVNLTVATNGDIYIEETFANPGTTYNTLLFWFPPSLYFNTDFGD